MTWLKYEKDDSIWNISCHSRHYISFSDIQVNNSLKVSYIDLPNWMVYWELSFIWVKMGFSHSNMQESKSSRGVDTTTLSSKCKILLFRSFINKTAELYYYDLFPFFFVGAMFYLLRGHSVCVMIEFSYKRGPKKVLHILPPNIWILGAICCIFWGIWICGNLVSWKNPKINK